MRHVWWKRLLQLYNFSMFTSHQMNLAMEETKNWKNFRHVKSSMKSNILLLLMQWFLHLNVKTLSWRHLKTIVCSEMYHAYAKVKIDTILSARGVWGGLHTNVPHFSVVQNFGPNRDYFLLINIYEIVNIHVIASVTKYGQCLLNETNRKPN